MVDVLEFYHRKTNFTRYVDLIFIIATFYRIGFVSTEHFNNDYRLVLLDICSGTDSVHHLKRLSILLNR